MDSQKQKRIHLGLIMYFVLATIIFFVGRYMIIIQYNIDTGPVKDGGFELLLNWVSIFALLFIVPLAILVFLGVYNLTRQRNNNLNDINTLTNTILMFSIVPFVAIISFVLFWAFILAFYGFAP